jgi:hypothetical protein
MVSFGETQSEFAVPGDRSLGCLVICHKQLGDLTLLVPAMAKLVEVYGGVDLLTRSGHAAGGRSGLAASDLHMELLLELVRGNAELASETANRVRFHAAKENGARYSRLLRE